MKIIKLHRGKGKTTEAIKLAAKGFYYIVCRHNKHATEIFLQSKKMGLDIPFPITFHNFTKGELYTPGIKGFIIDDIDCLFYQLLVGFLGGRELVGITHGAKLNFGLEDEEDECD